MIIEYLVVAILLGWATKGSLAQLTETDIKLWYFFIIGFLLQISSILFYPIFVDSSLVNDLYYITIFLSYTLILLAAWKNRHLSGIVIYGIGALLNSIVILSNGGRMPVSAEGLQQVGKGDQIASFEIGRMKHQLLTEDTHFTYLADVIPINIPFVFNPDVISIGDIFITLGIAWFIYSNMKRNKNNKNATYMERVQ